MMTPVIDWNDDGSAMVNASAVAELAVNNCTMPDISRVIYNLKTKVAKKDEEGKKVRDENGNIVFVDLEKPILATTIEFVDNTKVSVKNSLNDKVEIENKTLEDGSTVRVATEASKELGLVYALIKRLKGTIDDKGTVEGDGLGHWLRVTVSNAYDDNYETAKNKLLKAAAKKAHEDRQKNAKPKNPSMLETAIALAESQKELAECINTLRADLAEMKAKMA